MFCTCRAVGRAEHCDVGGGLVGSVRLSGRQTIAQQQIWSTSTTSSWCRCAASSSTATRSAGREAARARSRRTQRGGEGWGVGAACDASA